MFRARAFLSILALVAAIPFSATSGFATHVDPVLVDGNPTCTGLGFQFGFKPQPEPPPSGSYLFPDGVNTLTLDHDGTLVDWTSTLALDAFIVKGGSNANVYYYVPEETSDTDLHAPLNPSGQFASMSHVEVCYDYEVTVSKSANTTYTRTWNWTIDKSVTPSQWDLFRGDSGTSAYTVSVDKTGFTDSDWAVSGTITIENETHLSATITGVTDVISPSLNVAVDCGVTFPHDLASGASLECSYSSALPDGSNRTNTATVTTTGIVGGGTATAPVAFGAPTTVVNGSVNVTDTNGMSWGPVSDDASWNYSKTFTCDTDEGGHPNTAEITETGQSDDANVTVNCHALTVTKNATTTFDRDWDWDLEKDVDQSELVLAPGQVFTVSYTVYADAIAVDSGWAVTGDIWIANPHPSAGAPLTAVSDSVDGVAATVDCPALVVPAGGSLHCTYSADLPDGTDRTNTATATLQNYSYASDGTASASGTTDFQGTAPVTFGSPTNETDECVDVDDSLKGPLGAVCIDAIPASYQYSWEIGPYEDPDGCGLQEVVNTATATGTDSGLEQDSSTETVSVRVACGIGCTLTQGYWKTHSEYGPAPYDETWAELPGGADTVFFLSGMSWYQGLWTPPQGNAYWILAHQYMAATLNVLNGASVPPEVLDGLTEATGLFETYTPAQIGALKGNRAPRPRFLELAGLLDMYNNGILGPGHCSEDSQSGGN